MPSIGTTYVFVLSTWAFPLSRLNILFWHGFHACYAQLPLMCQQWQRWQSTTFFCRCFLQEAKGNPAVGISRAFDIRVNLIILGFKHKDSVPGGSMLLEIIADLASVTSKVRGAQVFMVVPQHSTFVHRTSFYTISSTRSCGPRRISYVVASTRI